jgi:hypothetical protein
MPHVTAETLAEALPQVMAAPRERSRVESLCFRPSTNQRDFPARLHLTQAEGIPGDRWRTEPWLTTADGLPDPEIQISILPLRVLDLVWQDRDSVVHPGDPIIADLDMSTANLPEGTRLQVGGAVLRVSGIWNDGCAKWKVRYGRAAYDWVKAHPELRLRGILCAVEADGEVAVGDEIRVLR